MSGLVMPRPRTAVALVFLASAVQPGGLAAEGGLPDSPPLAWRP
jgi:hypothetical protein